MALAFPKDDKRNFRKNLVKRHKLVGYLDNFLANEPTGFSFQYEGKEKDTAWHPSGHCTPSVSELYHIASTPQKNSEHGTNTQKNFLVGHFWHQLLQWSIVQIGLAPQSAIERKGVRVWNNEDLSSTDPPRPYNWATGAGDVAPCTIPRHGEYLVDFKTMHDRDFKTEGMPNWCAEKYEAQINIYMDMFDLEKALIIPVQKGTPHEFKEFTFARNQPLIDAIYNKWEMVAGLLDETPSQLELDELDEEFKLNGYFQGPIAQ